MMNPRFFLSLILITVFLVACAPASTSPAQSLDNPPTSTPPPATGTAKTALQTTLLPSETLAPTPLPVVTSRGPHLEATDPKTVSMAVGGLQFVEFFEFW